MGHKLQRMLNKYKIAQLISEGPCVSCVSTEQGSLKDMKGIGN